MAEYVSPSVCEIRKELEQKRVSHKIQQLQKDLSEFCAISFHDVKHTDIVCKGEIILTLKHSALWVPKVVVLVCQKTSLWVPSRSNGEPQCPTDCSEKHDVEVQYQLPLFWEASACAVHLLLFLLWCGILAAKDFVVNKITIERIILDLQEMNLTDFDEMVELIRISQCLEYLVKISRQKRSAYFHESSG